MALSTFLRTPACLMSVLKQSVARLATQPAAMHRLVSSNLPASNVLFKDANTSSPITNAVRTLRTTTPTATFAKDEHPHDHAKLWVIEKSVAAALVFIVPAALLYPNAILDSAMAILVSAHSFWGLEAIAVDYVREAWFGPVIPKIAIALVYAITIATLGGLFYLITHDIGIANSVRSIWAVKSQKQA